MEIIGNVTVPVVLDLKESAKPLSYEGLVNCAAEQSQDLENQSLYPDSEIDTVKAPAIMGKLLHRRRLSTTS